MPEVSLLVAKQGFKPRIPHSQFHLLSTPSLSTAIAGRHIYQRAGRTGLGQLLTRHVQRLDMPVSWHRWMNEKTQKEMEQSQESSQACPITSMPNPGRIHPRPPSSVLLLGRRVSGSLREQEWGSELSPVLSHSSRFPDNLLSWALFHTLPGNVPVHAQQWCQCVSEGSAVHGCAKAQTSQDHWSGYVCGLWEGALSAHISWEALRATRLPSACSA